jgi:N-acetylneuraminate synthase/sialic acid synthase
VIAEIANNHQGDLDIAKQMIRVAASCGVQAVKFQKRDNKALYTKAYYEKPYDNENSYGATYGEHRDYLEFDKDEYRELMKIAEECDVEFMCTAWDYESVDFLEDLGIASYKIASGDITSTPLLEHIAKLGKPMFISTGAATMDEVKLAYEAVSKHNDKICLLHCVAGYPTEYHFLNLDAIKALKEEFPEAIIGFSGHDNGILAGVMAYMLGATVLEKHFTLNRAWKGTDHRFSLEPEGLRKQVRDLRRVDISRGDGKKTIQDFEKDPRSKICLLYTSPSPRDRTRSRMPSCA